MTRQPPSPSPTHVRGGEPEKDLSFDHVIGYRLKTLLEKHGWETTMVLQRNNFSALEF